MPLFDHFRPPLDPHHRWESFHSNWATRIADALNENLPPDYPVPLSVGVALPTMPLRIVGSLFVPVDLEATYAEACRRRRIG